MTESKVEWADREIAILEEEDAAIPPYLKSSGKLETWLIKDPIRASIEEKPGIRSEIKERVEALVREIG